MKNIFFTPRDANLSKKKVLIQDVDSEMLKARTTAARRKVKEKKMMTMEMLAKKEMMSALLMRTLSPMWTMPTKNLKQS